MADEWALADYVKTLPPTADVATTFYPVERNLNLLAGRAVARIPAKADALAGHGLIIVDSVSREMLLKGYEPVADFGRYAVLKENP